GVPGTAVDDQGCDPGGSAGEGVSSRPPSWLLLRGELVEPGGQLEVGQVLLASIVRTARQAKGTAHGVATRLLSLLRGEPLLLGTLGRVAALALLALRLGPALARAATAHAWHPRHPRHPGYTAAPAHLAHHLLRLAEPLQQLVDLRDRHTRALGDTGSTGAVDLFRVRTLERRHRAHHRLDPVELLVVQCVELGA